MRLIESYSCKKETQLGWVLLFFIAKIDWYRYLKSIGGTNRKKKHSCTRIHWINRSTPYIENIIIQASTRQCDMSNNLSNKIKKKKKLHDRSTSLFQLSCPPVSCDSCDEDKQQISFRAKKKKSKQYILNALSTASSQTFGLCVKEKRKQNHQTEHTQKKKTSNKNHTEQKQTKNQINKKFGLAIKLAYFHCFDMFGPKSRNPLLFYYTYKYFFVDVCSVYVVDHDVFALFVQGRKRNVKRKK